MSEEDFHKQPTIPGEIPKTTPPISEVPKHIGPYKVECLLEKGGMSLLYLATHPETKEPTTIKVLSQKFLSQPEIVQRFLWEAEIIAMADHPNIVKLYGHGEWEGGLYIAMEFIQGISLRQYILQTPLSLKHALEIILDISYALCHLHTHGVIHRDLKPENILVTESGKIKVIDFGIAQLLTERTDRSSHPKQRLIGTPIYMSPEQRENPESVGYPSDIYSLGIVSYELILGKLSHGQIHLSLMPKGIQKILAKALQLDQNDRYQDIVDFITDISAYLHSASLEKEKKVSDQLTEMSDNLKTAQLAMIPKQPPQWEECKIGIILHQGINVTGVYYDFFDIDKGIYGVIIGETPAKGSEGMIYTAVLRGMIKGILQQTPNNPVETIIKLNRLLVVDPMQQVFTLSYLVLNIKENYFKYISCGYGHLWHIPAATSQPAKVAAENIALGIDESIDFSEVIHEWHRGDVLILNTFAAIAFHPDNDIASNEEIFRQALVDNLGNQPQKQVENLLRKSLTAGSRLVQERSLCLISILRT